MNEEQRDHLGAWYRQALARRAGMLETLVPALMENDPEARDRVRRTAWRLAGSGGTFGFPDVTEAARVVADAEDGLLPRSVGLIDVLRQVSSVGEVRGDRAGQWLVFAAGPLPDPPEGGAVPPDLGLLAGWERVAARLAVDQDALARRLASTLGVRVADPASAQRTAGLVVPPALALEYRILPLRDDGVRIVAASANPTDVLAMAALERGTGRSATLEVLPPGLLDRALVKRYGRGGTDGPPGHRAPPRPVHRGSGPADAPHPVAVLVVDDEPEARLLCRTVLERDGLSVLEASGAREALDALDGPRRVDAVLVDVLMPGMDGRELLQAIRSRPEHAHLPVVVLTGLESPEAEARLMEAGADDYLRKPVEPRILLARIHACLRRSRAAPAP